MNDDAIKKAIKELKERITYTFENWVDDVDIITEATAEYILRNALLEMMFESNLRALEAGHER